MRTENWKTIVIKSAQLSRMRTQLRIILSLAVRREIDRLNKISRFYDRKRFEPSKRRKYKGLTPSQRKRYDAIVKMKNRISSAYNHSILICGMGGICVFFGIIQKEHGSTSFNKDMVWNPIYKE